MVGAFAIGLLEFSKILLSDMVIGAVLNVILQCWKFSQSALEGLMMLLEQS